jgi:predicted DsbA family dithiol-disulfide isomerase
MKKRIKIDFVSDISCPWCAIGLNSLEQALSRVGEEVTADIHFQPFELNPQLSAEGEDITEHLQRKYGASAAQSERNREAIRARGAEVGFRFQMDKRNRIYNTFDAHRLLHWADLEARQQALEHALFEAYFSEGKNPSDREVLVDIAAAVGLDPERARQILFSDEYAQEVRERERFYLEQGVHAVPAVIIDDRHLIQGAQPVAAFERALRQVAAD